MDVTESLLDAFMLADMSPQALACYSRINVDKLEYECAIQPFILGCAGKLANDAKWRAEQAKAELELVRANVEKDVRKNPSIYGVEKVTEGSVDCAVKSDHRVVAAKQKVIDCAYAADNADTILTVFTQKNSMLKAEVELSVQRYWVDTKTPGIADRATAAIAEMRK